MSRGEAQLLLDSQLLKDTFAQMEADATERAITADVSDDERRRVSAMEVRAIRSVREELRSHLEPATNLEPVPVV